MKLKSKFVKSLCTMLSLILLSTNSTTLLAQNYDGTELGISNTQNYDPIAEVKYVSSNNIIPTASVNRRTITADIAIISMKANTPSNGTISIQKSEKGSWKTFIKWQFSEKGTRTISKRYSGKRGTYRVYVSGMVGNDKITCYSSTVSIR